MFYYWHELTMLLDTDIFDVSDAILFISHDYLKHT